MKSGTHSHIRISPVTLATTAPAMAGPKAPNTIGAGLMNRESTSAALIAGDIFWSVSRGWFANCIARARPFSGEVLPAADEVFLREHRYRDVVICPGKRKSARQISKLGKVCRRTWQP